MINMVIYDPTTNRMEERFTTDGFDLDAINHIRNSKKKIGRKNFKFKTLNVSNKMGHMLQEISESDNGTEHAASAKLRNIRDQQKPKPS